MRMPRAWFLFISLIAAFPALSEGGAEGSGQELALRKNLLIIGSPVVKPYIEMSVQHFVARRQLPPPVVEFAAPAAVYAKFCSGVGVDFPDVAAAHRRISRSEFRLCGDKGTGDIVEVAVGFESLVLAIRKGGVPFNVSAESLYRALALEIPRDGAFFTNVSRSWREADPLLPDQEIFFALPSSDHGLRQLFDDRAMEGGCRSVAEIRNIASAEARVRKCVTAREDARLFNAQRQEDLAAFLERSPPGAVAALPRDLYERLGQAVTSLPYEGVLPTQKSLENGDYMLGRRIYFYFKVKHMHDKKGYGVTRGLKEYLLDVTGEQAADPGGYFERAGLSLLPPAERARQRLESLLLRPMNR